MSRNHLVSTLKKSNKEFTKADIVKYVEDEGIEMINFMYPASDGRLKTCGGTSLFPFIEAGSSDLYVMPRYSTAFRDPFAEIPTVTMLCSFFDKDGNPLESSPEYTLHKACKAFKDVTGMEFHAMGELEYYVIAPSDGMYPASDQKGYHESAPFAKFNEFRTRCMSYVAQTGGQFR